MDDFMRPQNGTRTKDRILRRSPVKSGLETHNITTRRHQEPSVTDVGMGTNPSRNCNSKEFFVRLENIDFLQEITLLQASMAQKSSIFVSSPSIGTHLSTRYIRAVCQTWWVDYTLLLSGEGPYRPLDYRFHQCKNTIVLG